MKEVCNNTQNKIVATNMTNYETMSVVTSRKWRGVIHKTKESTNLLTIRVVGTKTALKPKKIKTIRN